MVPNYTYLAIQSKSFSFKIHLSSLKVICILKINFIQNRYAIHSIEYAVILK